MSFDYDRVNLGEEIGFGLIANMTFKKDQVIGNFSWRRPTKEELEDDEGKYLLVFDEDDKRIMIGDFKFINHSENDNVIIYSSGEIQAKKDIKKGHLLLSNYGSIFTDAVSDIKKINPEDYIRGYL